MARAKTMTDDPTTPGCLMCDSLYLKPDGTLPCWDDVGEDLILGRLDVKAVESGEVPELFDSKPLRHIRSSFLEGRLPHPSFCSRCAVRGHGRVDRLSPQTMNVLHIEPTYLCQLACPQCFTPHQRLEDKRPPYYMSLAFYTSVLDALVRQGVEHIRFIHFEGRGDPLLHQELGEMVHLARQRFPSSMLGITTHGNYPFAPWMIDSGLDLLRLSVDGAFEESYQRYRVGGRLERVLTLMRQLRDAKRAAGATLHVEWKYILFEWNDSDRELREAERLARELDAHLRFCLTHTEGRSQRFMDEQSLAQGLARLAPSASYDTTFQSRAAGSNGDATAVVAEHVQALLLDALRHVQTGHLQAARPYLLKALSDDPGSFAGLASRLTEEKSLASTLASCAPNLSYPSTASALANIALALGGANAAVQLFERYLELAPRALDRSEVDVTLQRLRRQARWGRRAKERVRGLFEWAVS